MSDSGTTSATYAFGSGIGEDEVARLEAQGAAFVPATRMILAERMGQMMNDAALSLMVSVGHRTGLFDVMAAMPAATSGEIAARAGLNERYVRGVAGRDDHREDRRS